MSANWVAFGFKCAQTDFKLGSDIMNVTANYLSSKTKQAQLEAQERNYREQMTQFEKQAGQYQKSGRQAREQRMIRAGQDVGQINASAAGSGIDVTSKSVAKTVKDTLRSAYNDAATSAQNEAIAAQDAINARQTAQENAIWTNYAARMEKNNRKWGVVSGALSAAGNWAGGMADAGSALMS
jgi:hypothetical protein